MPAPAKECSFVTEPSDPKLINRVRLLGVTKSGHIATMSSSPEHSPSEPHRIALNNVRTNADPTLQSPSTGILSSDALDALDQLGRVLRDVYRRMRLEGYDLVDGEIRKVPPEASNDPAEIQP